MRIKFLALIFSVFCVLMSFCSCENNTTGNSSTDSESSNIEKEPQVTYDIKTEDISMRDICILPDERTGTYYMIGMPCPQVSKQVIGCYQSKDLENWGTADYIHLEDQWEQNWAPEIHEYNGSYYIFANLRFDINQGYYRGCYILKSDKPYSGYKMYSGRVTPENWECLDGTLYVEDGIPYMIYCREWTRMIDSNGEIYRVRLKDDLSGVYPGAEHIRMFTARDHKSSNDGITDGCWMYTASNGDLVMFWSKYRDEKYMVITTRSKSGKIDGEWTHDTEPLWTDDGGHAMVFKDFEGNLKIAFHVNSTKHPNEHPVIYNLEDNNGVFRIIK